VKIFVKLPVNSKLVICFHSKSDILCKHFFLSQFWMGKNHNQDDKCREILTNEFAQCKSYCKDGCHISIIMGSWLTQFWYKYKYKPYRNKESRSPVS